MMREFETDVRPEEAGYVNPIYLMSSSGARGGVEQIRQLAGMRGLMAKPSGEIIETPIKANFREGLSVLEYFSSTHGARKGLADTALKTADSGYLTRKLADICQNVVITEPDCGTTEGITKGVVYRSEKVEVGLADAIRGRVSRTNIVNPITDEVIVREDDLIDDAKARQIEEMGVEKIKVRSPLTCRSKLGMCQLCYGMDLSNGSLVEEGLAVGIVAAQSIGEPGTQLTMRTFHIGGTASRDVEESEVRTRHTGRIRFERVRSVGPDDKKIALGRNGEIVILELNPREGRERELERYRVPNGAVLQVEEWDATDPDCQLPKGIDRNPLKGIKGIKGVCLEGEPLCKWDPHSVPIIAEVSGLVKLENCREGKTINVETDPNGNIRRTVMEYKGEKHPQISLVDKSGETQAFYYLPEKASIEVDDGQRVAAGKELAKTPREAGRTQDITGGLPRVTELFEARRPKDPAVIAEIDGEIELAEETRRNQRVINIHPPDEAGEPASHLIPHGKQLLVHAKDLVRHGDALVRGPLVPHDILRVSGVEAVQQYLMHEIQNVYRSQRVDIDDKHVEIVITQMLRKVRVEDAGDTELLEGVVIDKLEFERTNERVRECVKVVEPGGSEYKPDDVVPKEIFEEVNAEIEAAGETAATSSKPQEATMTIQLLGITKAAVQSESFVSSASFQETTKVLTEAALAGKSDFLVGLKENVILGHLVPAGTGFHMHQDSEVRIRPEALLELEAEKERLRLARMKMYNGEEEAAATGATPAVGETASQEAPAE